MSELTDAMLGKARTETVAQLRVLGSSTKDKFLDTFRGFVNPQDLVDLEGYFDKAFQAKVVQFSAVSPFAAAEAVDEYEAYMLAIQTIGDRYEIVGKAKAGVLLRSLAHQLISGFFAVAGAVLQVGLGILFPVVGNLGGAALNTGIQHVVAYFLED